MLIIEPEKKCYLKPLDLFNLLFDRYICDLFIRAQTLIYDTFIAIIKRVATCFNISYFYESLVMHLRESATSYCYMIETVVLLFCLIEDLNVSTCACAIFYE